VLTAYLDGFIQVDHEITVSQSTVSLNITLLGETHQNILALDDNGLPLNYSLAGTSMVIYSIGSPKVSISYLTQDLTSKVGKYWTINVEYPESLKLIMPSNSSIISLNNVPDSIETLDGCLTLTMPPGETEVTYTAKHATTEQANVPSNEGFQIWQVVTIVALSTTVFFSAVGIGLLRRKKPANALRQIQMQESSGKVDVDKLLSKHRELRQDEIQVIRFLATKNGKAFESELFELLNLPRTTTWRLIRRLEGMEIVQIKKSRRQNVVLVREKYLKKQAD
jgi:uncharacterized membrane protein